MKRLPHACATAPNCPAGGSVQPAGAGRSGRTVADDRLRAGNGVASTLLLVGGLSQQRFDDVGPEPCGCAEVELVLHEAAMAVRRYDADPLQRSEMAGHFWAA